LPDLSRPSLRRFGTSATFGAQARHLGSRGGTVRLSDGG
jgi:hypothetical protein